MAANPMTQFNVYRIGPEIKVGEIDISFTNASLFMVISTIVILLIFFFVGVFAGISNVIRSAKNMQK